MLKRSSFIVVLLCNVLLFTGAIIVTAHAACSPGIPCTDYELYTDWNAGQDANMNGPKTGLEDVNYSESSCDGNFMNQIYSKAYMEGQRQVIMSEQLIHKPDSVLEYTCFDGYVDHAAAAAPVFSETTRWQSYSQTLDTADNTDTKNYNVTRAVVESNRGGSCSEACAADLGQALSYLIDEPLAKYINGNFSHTYLGEASTIDYAAGGGVGCSDMATVWAISKCFDFNEDDRFRTFQSLIDGDPRTIPRECSPGHSFADDIDAGVVGTKLDTTTPSMSGSGMSELCPASAPVVAGVNTGFSNDLIRVSNNCPEPGNPDNTHAYATVDLIELIDYMILGVDGVADVYFPGTGGTSGTTGAVTCSQPVPTGIPVITYEHEHATSQFFSGFWTGDPNKFVHYEYICPNPGCYYRPPKIPLPNELFPIPSFDDFVSTYGTGMCIGY